MSEKQYFEVVGLRPDGDSFGVEVLGEQTEKEGRRLAKHYADLWSARVNLYRVPFLHLGSEGGFPHQLHLIRTVEPETYTPSQRPV
jgi:hypothetical protein